MIFKSEKNTNFKVMYYLTIRHFSNDKIQIFLKHTKKNKEYIFNIDVVF